MSKTKRRQQLVGWGFVLLSVLLILTFYFYPMLQALIMSFKTGPGNNLTFSGLDNYKRLFSDPAFIVATKNTIIFLLFQVPIMVLLSILFSVVLNNKAVKLKGMFRTIIFLPAVTSLVAYSIVFKSLFANNGIINHIITSLHIVSEPIAFFSSPIWSKVIIVIAITWRWKGYNMIFFLSALQNIDPEIYEAARIDGANPVKQFFYVTVPMLKPVILFSSVTSTIGTLQLFDEPMNLTQGGPGNATTTISQYIYNISFKYTPDFGYAAAVSYAIVVLVILFSLIQFKVGGKEE